MSILFLFFTVGFAARSVIAEKRGGTLARILSGPTSPAAMILGKTLSVSALALAGFVTIWGVTTVVFGADWGPPAAVFALMGATVIAVTGEARWCPRWREPHSRPSVHRRRDVRSRPHGGNFLGPGQPPNVLRRRPAHPERLGAPRVHGPRVRVDHVDEPRPDDPGPPGFGVVFDSVGLTRCAKVDASLTDQGPRGIRGGAVPVSRDRTALFFMLALPIIVMVIIGVAFGGLDGAVVGVVVLDDSRSRRWPTASMRPNRLTAVTYQRRGGQGHIQRQMPVALIPSSTSTVSLSQPEPATIGSSPFQRPERLHRENRITGALDGSTRIGHDQSGDRRRRRSSTSTLQAALDEDR